jgi:hypothetical protein
MSQLERKWIMDGAVNASKIDASSTDQTYVMHGLRITSDATIGNVLSVVGQSKLSDMSMSGNAIIGTQLTVNGQTRLNSTLYASDTTISNGLVQVGKDLTAVGNISVGGGISVTLPPTFSSLTVTGTSTLRDATMSSGMRASGDATFASKMRVLGDTTLGGGLNIANSLTAPTLNGDTTIGGGFRVTHSLTAPTLNGDTTIGGGLRVNNSLTAPAINGDSTISGGFKVNNRLTASSLDIATLTITDATITGNLTANKEVITTSLGVGGVDPGNYRALLYTSDSSAGSTPPASSSALLMMNYNQTTNNWDSIQFAATDGLGSVPTVAAIGAQYGVRNVGMDHSLPADLVFFTGNNSLVERLRILSTGSTIHGGMLGVGGINPSYMVDIYKYSLSDTNPTVLRISSYTNNDTSSKGPAIELNGIHPLYGYETQARIVSGWGGSWSDNGELRFEVAIHGTYATQMTLTVNGVTIPGTLALGTLGYLIGDTGGTAAKFASYTGNILVCESLNNDAYFRATGGSPGSPLLSQAKLTADNGQVYIEALNSRVTVKASNGNIDMTSVSGHISFGSDATAFSGLKVNGSLTAPNINGDTTVSGGFLVSTASKQVKLSAVRVDTTASLNVDMTAAGGDIGLSATNGNVNIVTGSGGRLVGITSGAGLLTINALSGIFPNKSSITTNTSTLEIHPNDGSSGNLLIDGDVYTSALQEWTQGSSSPQGFSAISYYLMFWKKVGKLIHLWYEIIGTSDSSDFSFSLPIIPSSTGPEGMLFSAPMAMDENIINPTPGVAAISSASTSCILYKDCSFLGTGGGWSSSPFDKGAAGYICYECDFSGI